MRSPLRKLLWGCVGLGVLGAVVLGIKPLRRTIDSAQPKRWQVAEAALLYGIRTDHSLRIAMPDGTRLAASLYVPKGAEGPLPTILVRVPYGRLEYGEAYSSGLYFARQGYAALVVDLRGTGDSEGQQLPWRDAADDGVALLEWIGRQSWADGKVGTFGCSALGETQLVLAKRSHPAHLALIASGAGGAIGSLEHRYGYFGLFEGGVFELASGFGWFAGNGAKDPHAPPPRAFSTAEELRKLPLAGLVSGVRPAPNAYDDFLGTPLGDPRWDQWGYLTDADRIEVPSFIINTWYDQTVGDALVISEHMRRTVPRAAQTQRVVIAPGGHCHHESDAPDALPLRDWYLRWFDRWLRGRGPGLDDESPYTYYMLDENRWYHATQWPPRKAQTQRWYLSSGGHANSSAGDGSLARQGPGAEAADTFVYDPMKPVPSRGGAACCTGDPHAVTGAVDQSEIERRDDVLVYTSQPLAQELRIAGPLKATLTISSDVMDTDLVARLVDVRPDGTALNIQEGALRLRYRDGVPARLMVPGQEYTVTVDMRSIAYRVARGHRLRLDVSSSSFPRLERNLNTGGDNYTATRSRVATNRLLHGGDAQAFVELPVLTSK
jgi:putative CocE/NonD family hydrolase